VFNIPSNVLFLSEVISPHGSGGDVATKLYANLLADSGVNVKIVTNRYLDEPTKSESRRLTIYRLPLFTKEHSLKYLPLERPGILFSDFMKNLIGWADVVYIPRCWYPAIPVVKAYNKPVVLHLHSYNLTCPTGSMYDFSKNAICTNHRCIPKCITMYEQATGRGFGRVFLSAALNLTIGRFMAKCIEMSDALICVSKAQRELTVKRKPSLADRIKVVYNPLPTIGLLPIEGKDLGYFGGPNLLKGFHVFLRALGHVSKTVVHATKFSKMQNHIALVGNSRIMFYGRLKKEAYQKIYAQISTVLVPSVWPETWGYVVTEGLLRGRLIIASPSGGIPEQITGLKGCFTFDAGNYKQLAELINYVKGISKESAIDLGLKNRAAFLEKFSNDRILKDFMGILDKVCNN